jgi:hypothetical protein
LATGLALLGFSWIPFLAKLLGGLLAKQVLMLNSIVDFVAGLPGAVSGNLYFPWIKVFLIYALVVMLYWTVRKQEARYVAGLLGVALLLLGFQTLLRFSRLKQHQMVVYAIRGHTAIDLIQGSRAVLLLDSALLKQPKNLAYATQAYHIRRGIKLRPVSLSDSVSLNWVKYQHGFLNFGSQKYFVVDAGHPHFPVLDRKIALEFLVYRGKKYIPLSEIAHSFEFKQLIIDSSVPNWLRKRLVQECKHRRIIYLDVANEGSKIFQLEKK